MTDEQIAQALANENEEFKALSDEHASMKAKLAEFQSKLHLTPEEELQKRQMQKQKLAQKDKMADMIREYKAAQTA